MNENKRTVTYVVVAAVAALIAAEPWSRRSLEPTAQEQTGKLFPDFKDARAAASMKIDKFDDLTGQVHKFEVARVGGVWSIPSHHGYPADAKEHLAQAATALMDIDILGVAGDKPGEHELYGLLDPEGESISPGSVGVGNRVTMKDASDNVLADLIIGKSPKDQPNLRYVRKAGKDQVYTVAVQTDKLSTKFGDWIEKDLLKLNPIDVVSVQLNDYSSEGTLTARGQLTLADFEQRNQILLDYNEAKNAWTVGKLVNFVKNKPVADELKENEEVNAEKLAAMKTALGDLKIVDVAHKPKGLEGMRVSAQLSGEQLELASRGFYAVTMADGSQYLVSSEGEAIISMKDGVEYILRFGQAVSNEEDAKDDPAKDAQGKPKPGSHVNRYLFVMAQFNPELIPKPKLEPLPGEEGTDQAKADGEKAEGDKTDEAKADADKPEGDKADGDKKADEKPADDDKAKQTKEEDEAEKKKIEAEKREKIERDNKHKQEVYDEKLKAGQAHVKELNDRFADWYYIISDDVYHKIHLGRGDVVKTKETKPGEGNTPADLKALEKQGLGK